MKTAVSNIAWDMKDDESVYSIMKNNGFSGLEIAPTRFVSEEPYIFKNIVNVKHLLDATNFQIVSMQSILFGRSEKIFGSQSDRDNLTSYLKLAVDYAAFIGCPNLVFGSPKNRIINNVNSEYSIAVEFFRNIGCYAAANNVVIAMEANPVIYGTNFINTTKEACALANEVDSAGFKINLDFGTIIYNEENIEDVRNYIEHVNHVHISEPGLEVIQERKEHRKLHDILVSAGYKKYISLEMKKPEDFRSLYKSIEYIGGVFCEN